MKKKETPLSQILESSSDTPHAITEMPLNTVDDYWRYNREARKLNKKLRICRYPIKQCPIELHPHQKIEFMRNDQPTNPLPVYLSNDRIEFKEILHPGKTYRLPQCVIEYLAGKGTPVWQRFTKPDGTTENKVTGFNPRFSLRTIYEERTI